MTATTIDLPDRYRPIDQIAPDEPTATGVIHSWRAKDRVLNRDVAVRVHTPGGEAARSWIARALTAGGLATPGLAMVYDAAEGSGDAEHSGASAYVVNEWIEGQTLAERIHDGPLPERDARRLVRRLAEGVAEAHKVGLAVGGLTPEHMVLRPGGLVGLRAVPAATGTIQGDIAALGALLEICLTGQPPPGRSGAGRLPRPAPIIRQPDLAALIRRTQSTDPGATLSSVAAMVALLNERTPTGNTHPFEPVREPGSDPGPRPGRESNREPNDGGRRRRRGRAAAPTPADAGPDIAADVGDEAEDADLLVRLDPQTRPPVPPAPAGDRYPDERYPDDEEGRPGATPPGRRRLLVICLPLLALAVVIGVAWWLGTHVLSVAGSVDDQTGSTPPASTSASSAPAENAAALTITAAQVFDPFGDGASENDEEVPLSYDGDPATGWSTLTYRGAPEFGNLKPGVGVLYDLGSEQSLSGATLATSLPGAAVEIRVGDDPDGDLDGFQVVTSGDLEGDTELAFDAPVTTRYLLVWVTTLVPADDGFRATISEVSLQPAT